MTTFDSLVLTYVILAYAVAIVAAWMERRKRDSAIRREMPH